VIDTVVTQYLEGDYKFVTNTVVYTFPDGLDVEVFPFEVLESAWKGATSKSEREHVTSYIRNHTRLRTRNVYSGVQYPPYRLTLDYPEDYQLIVAIYEGIDRELFHLDEVVRFLGEHGELARINEHIERKIAHHALPGDPTSYVKDKDTL
jgi:spore coat polysaccharide biosynthesis protein SpsF